MILDTNNINSAGGPRSRGTSAPVSNNAKTSTPSVDAAVTTSKDDVILSPEAKNLVRLQAKISSLPDVNMDRVASIKQAIAEGRFDINPDRIAENMLKQDELLG